MAGPRGRAAARAIAGFAHRPLDQYTALFARYGDTVRIPFMPGRSLFILSRPEHAEHVLATGQDNYVKAFTYRPLRVLIGDGLLTSEGAAWRRHRRIIQPIFSRRRVAAFAPQITAGAGRMLSRWDAMPAGTIVNASAEMSALALDVVGRVLFSSDLRGETAVLGRALRSGQRAAVVATLTPVPEPAARALSQVLGGPAETVADVVRRLVDARRQQGPGAAAAQDAAQGAADDREAGPGAAASGTAAADGQQPRDLLGLLMAARDEDGSGLSEDEIRDEVATFLLAGHETTANALSWSLALLSAYPAARDRVEEEIGALPGGDLPGADALERLPWTTAVVSEAMRLYPPAWVIEREAVAGDDVCGVPVPARSTVAVSPYLIHRHPEFWPNPGGFDPRRFLTGADGAGGTAGGTTGGTTGGTAGGAVGGTAAGAVGGGVHRYAYIPFGAGRRGCVGAGLAQLEAALVLATLCRRYRLDLVAHGLPVPDANVTLRPGRALPMRLTRRG